MKVLEFEASKVIFEESTGKWIQLENEGYDIYVKGKMEHTNDQEINDFVAEVDKYLAEKNIVNENEKGLTVLLTNRCNLSCIHCFYASSASETTMLDFTQEYRDFIDEYVKDGLKWICFTGGEPLLNPDFAKFITHAADRNLNISVMTNGILVTDEIAELLAQYNVSVQVSLDGLDEVYEEMRGRSSNGATEGIKKLINRGVSTDISFLPCKVTIGDYSNVVNWAKRMHVNLIHMPFLEKYGRAEENYDRLALTDDEFAEFLERIVEDYFSGEYGSLKVGFIENIKNQLLYPQVKDSCKACKELALGVDSNGDVYPCSELIMDIYKIGNIRNSLYDIRQNFRNKIVDIASVN